VTGWHAACHGGDVISTDTKGHVVTIHPRLAVAYHRQNLLTEPGSKRRGGAAGPAPSEGPKRVSKKVSE
jgi:hypothetical protein